jgi:hypothetical protein
VVAKGFLDKPVGQASVNAHQGTAAIYQFPGEGVFAAGFF